MKVLFFIVDDCISVGLGYIWLNNWLSSGPDYFPLFKPAEDDVKKKLC